MELAQGHAAGSVIPGFEAGVSESPFPSQDATQLFSCLDSLPTQQILGRGEEGPREEGAGGNLGEIGRPGDGQGLPQQLSSGPSEAEARTVGTFEWPAGHWCDLGEPALGPQRGEQT